MVNGYTIIHTLVKTIQDDTQIILIIFQTFNTNIDPTTWF